MGCSGPVRPQPSKSPEELQGLWDKGLVQGLGTDRQVCIFSWTHITKRRRRLYKEIADRRNRKCMKKQQHLSIPGNNFSCFIYCPISFPFTTACYHAKQQAALKKTSCAQLWTSCRLSSVHHHCPLLGWRSALTPQPRVPQARTLTLALIEELVQALAFQHEVIMTLMRRVWIRGLHADRKTALTCCFNYRTVCPCRARRRKGVRAVKRMKG